MKGVDYLKFLDDEIMPWCKAQFRRSSFTFQQDNSSVHTEKNVRKFLDRIDVLKWLACNPNQHNWNFWHLMELKLYARGEFKSGDQLWAAKLNKQKCKKLLSGSFDTFCYKNTSNFSWQLKACIINYNRRPIRCCKFERRSSTTESG